MGRRGEGRFEQVSWNEALDKVASELLRVKKAYGNSAILLPYGTGSYSQTNGRQVAQRLLNLFGGSLGHYNNYSWAAMARATETVYGTTVTGNQRQDWLNAKLILMWGWNPSQYPVTARTPSSSFARRASRARASSASIEEAAERRRALRRVGADPPGDRRGHDDGDGPRDGEAGRHDAAFVAGHSVGFDQSQMPADAQGAETYKDYLLGTRDKVPKTTAWAERITGVPSATIQRLAREYATRKPGVLYQGYGMQRRGYGEQVVRAGCVLAALDRERGNPGRPGRRARAAGAVGRAAVVRVPGRREPGQGQHSDVPLDRGGRSRKTARTRARRPRCGATR